jgi:hypothetical protein
MPERVCKAGCGYEVSDHSGTAHSRSFPTECQRCGADLIAPTTDRPDGDVPPEVQAFAEEHGLDPEEVAAERGDL